jgi:hypothetical protein
VLHQHRSVEFIDSIDVAVVITASWSVVWSLSSVFGVAVVLVVRSEIRNNRRTRTSR